MAFKRIDTAPALPEGRKLTCAMAGIGMALAVPPDAEANIEDTLLAASIEGMEQNDLRVLAVLATWIEFHHPWVNVDRLTRAVASGQRRRVDAFWAAVGTWLHRDRRWSRMAHRYAGPRIDLLHVGTEFQLERRGEDPRFQSTCLRAPTGILRRRPSDILAPAELAKRHRVYRSRIRIGPSYRADMWAMLEGDPLLNPSTLARRSYGSFATAWRVKKDFGLLSA